MSIVLGEDLAYHLQGLGGYSPSEDLLRSGLADPDDSALLSMGDQGIYFFRNPAAAHSCVRWIAPDGDRTIVVLPGEYGL